MLIGRERELGTIGQGVAAVADGEVRSFVLTAEAGMGKSALLGAVSDLAAGAGLQVLTGRAAEHERDVPFGLAIDALDEVVGRLHPRRAAALAPELAAVLPAAADDRTAPPATAGPAERFRYHRALTALLAHLAGERPLALLLDDVHWADAASLEWVLHLLRRPAPRACLLVLATRPVDPAPQLLAAARETAVHLTLEPLSFEDALRMLDDLPSAGLRDRIAREAAGNPLFLRELARNAREPEAGLPPTLVAAVRADVERLPPASRTLLEGAAVAGDPFDLDLAAAIADLSLDDARQLVDRLIAEDLVRRAEHGATFAFRHPLVWRAVYESAPAGWRIGAHARAAAALAARGSGPAQRAYHLERCASPGDEAAIALLTEAGHRAADTAPAVAAHWYRAALRLLTDEDPARRAQLLGPLALSLTGAGRMAEGHDALLEVLDLLPAGPSSMRTALTIGCASVERVLGRVDEAHRRLLSAFDETPDTDGAAEIALELAGAAMWSERLPEALDWARRADSLLPERSSAQHVTAHALVATAHLLHEGKPGPEVLLDRARQRFDALDDSALAEHLDAALALGTALTSYERHREADAIVARGLAVARASRQDRLLAPLANLRGMNLQNLLRLDESLAELDVAEEIGRLQGVGFMVQWSLWARALAYYERGEPSEAERAAVACLEVLRDVDESTMTLAGRANIGAIRSEHDPERGIDEVLAAAGPRLEAVDRSWRTWLLYMLVRAAVATGRLDDAAGWMDGAEAAAPLPASRARVHCAAGELGLARGDAGVARAAARRALALVSFEQAPREALMATILEGRAAAADDARDEAVAALKDAARRAGTLGAQRLAAEGHRELRRLGVRAATSIRHAGGGAPLSARERDIAQLAVAGRSNRQIAGALFLSEKTVENNLSRVYAKLGVRSRVELTARWDELAGAG